MKKAIVLFSGGVDSTVCLATAIEAGRECYALSFDYGQRHRVELEAAAAICEHYSVTHTILKVETPSFKQSALVSNKEILTNRTADQIAAQGIPSTYVPARNTIFLAYALGHAELIGAEEIYFGCNAMDRLPYPDCRPEFVNAFQALMNVATKQSVEGKGLRLLTPLIDMDKSEIIRLGKRLGAPLEKTFTCYNPSEKTPCRVCDACILRQTSGLP